MSALSRHSVRVKILRLVLPVLAGIGLLTVLIWPVVTEMQEKFTKATSRFEAEEMRITTPAAGQPAQLHMANPRFTGLDEQGRPYEITADSVQQGLSTAMPMTLNKPKARMVLDKENDTRITVTADTGSYSADAQTLELQGGVTVGHSDGYVFHLQDIHINLQQGFSQTDHPVSGSGPMGTLTGDRMEMRDKGDHIILFGRSKLVLQAAEEAG